MQVLGGKEIPGCSLSEMLSEELAFFLQGHKSPATASAPLSIKAGRSDRVVLPQPLPNGLHGDKQQIRDAIGREFGRVREPDGQSSLVGSLVWSVLDPGHELIGREPGRQAGRHPHRVPLGKQGIITLCLLSNWYQRVF